jgi:hypothetical protein
MVRLLERCRIVSTQRNQPEAGSLRWRASRLESVEGTENLKRGARRRGFTDRADRGGSYPQCSRWPIASARWAVADHDAEAQAKSPWRRRSTRGVGAASEAAGPENVESA